MSRVTYLLGAGASYGERIWNEYGHISRFVSGLPVVNEFAQALQLLPMRDEQGSGVLFTQKEAEKREVSTEQYNDVRRSIIMKERYTRR